MPPAKSRWPYFNRRAEIAWVREQRRTMLTDVLRVEKEALGRRIAETRKLFRRKLFIGDLHSHTPFSDGVSSVAENRAVADLMGFDFLFITDHRTQRHRRQCDGRAGVYWGQEPPSCGREIGVLMPRSLLVPRHDSLAGDFARARRIAPFAWVPHPAGYGRNTRYPAAMAKQLWTLGDRFAMEVLNGCHKFSRAYDGICADAVALLDRLLCGGRQVSVLGVSDAHICWSVGTAWTGVYSATPRGSDVVEALNAGRSFASEAPLLWLGCDGAAMGEVVRVRPGARVRARFAAADSLGLHSVRLVSNGRTVYETQPKDARSISGEFVCESGRGAAHLRLECTASDQRRAFSSPLFLAPVDK